MWIKQSKLNNKTNNRPMKIRTKKELVEWIETAQNQGYTVPVVINGGGFSWISTEDNMSGLANDEDYADEVEYLEPGGEFPDFRECMSKDELDGVVFVRLPHLTAFGQENIDYQFGIWEL